MRQQLLIGLLAGGLCSSVFASSPSAEPEVFLGNPEAPSTPVLKSGIQGLNPSVQIALSAPGTAELATLDPHAVPPVIGIGRAIPADQQLIDGSQLAWSPLPGGGQAAVFSVRSPGAQALRLQLDLAALPAGIELRFYAPLNAAEVSGSLVTGASGVGDGIWSPSVSGDTLAVEVFLPDALSPTQLSVPLTRLSHMAADPAQPSSFYKDLNDIGGSEACQIDAQCRTLPESARNSVAKMVITDQAGQAGFCTGTLLADNDPNTQIPYFLTAHHCGVGEAQVAANIEFYWGFERAACNGPNPDNVTRTAGGGTPLSSAQRELGNDHALLRLNQNPPAGSTLSGWTATRAAVNSGVTGIHHPNGDIKKVSAGTVGGYVSTAAAPGNPAVYSSFADVVGPYLNVQWQEGVTEGGSSGSALWLTNSADQQNGPYVVGALLGGGSACNNPQAGDQYGSFDLTYKASRFWLDGSTDHTTIWVDTSRNGQGLQLLQNGNSLSGAWYTYDANGNPMWLTFVATIANNTASAGLLRFTGPALGAPWSNPTAQEVGQATVNFSPDSPTSVSFNYTVDGVSGSLNLSPFTSLAAGGYSGVWFDPATNGQGVQLIQSGDVIQGAWYQYDANGVARWYTFVGQYSDFGSIDTNLLSFTGPALGQPWDANLVQATTGGQINLVPNGATSITMNYTIGNVQGTLNLQPFNL